MHNPFRADSPESKVLPPSRNDVKNILKRPAKSLVHAAEKELADIGLLTEHAVNGMLPFTRCSRESDGGSGQFMFPLSSDRTAHLFWQT